jgi:ATP-binding cassette, subfamily G (WHITE), member 2, SNQ2
MSCKDICTHLWECVQLAEPEICVNNLSPVAILGFCMTPFLWFMSIFGRFLPVNPMPTRTILHKYVCVHISTILLLNPPSRSSGVLRPGEMCLVLGCPGAGCTTFLKAIANQREGYASVLGDVRYAGMDAKEISKYYKGEVVYNLEGKRASR